jgi:hypothetical protein
MSPYFLVVPIKYRFFIFEVAKRNAVGDPPARFSRVTGRTRVR